MTIDEHWLIQREKLLLQLKNHQEIPQVIYHVRHAISQTEQNSMAEIQDDILRQQAGILFGCVKSSVGLLDTHATARVWIPQSHSKEKNWNPFLLPFACFAGSLFYCFWKELWLPAILLIAFLASVVQVYFKSNKGERQSQSEARVTVQTDPERLLPLLDAQFRSIDRYLSDFAYLNESLKVTGECTDPAAVSYASDLLETIYEYEKDDRTSAEEAAKKLLETLGFKILDYSEETSRCFHVLPSKNTTQTLKPAILSAKDQQLLRRGTAVVRIDVV